MAVTESGVAQPLCRTTSRSPGGPGRSMSGSRSDSRSDCSDEESVCTALSPLRLCCPITASPLRLCCPFTAFHGPPPPPPRLLDSRESALNGSDVFADVLGAGRPDVHVAGAASRRRDCHSTDSPSPSTLKLRATGRGRCSRMTVSPTARRRRPFSSARSSGSTWRSSS